LDTKNKKGVFASLAEKEGYFSFDLYGVDLDGKDFPFMK
jgi:hypothetical protein